MNRDIPFDEEVAERTDREREEYGDRHFVATPEYLRSKWAEDFDRRVAEDRKVRHG